MAQFIRIILFFAFLLSSTAVYAGDKTVFEMGARGGVNDNRNYEDFTAGEVYLLRNLPWQMPLAQSATLRTRLDAGVTFLEAAGEQSAMLAIGGDLFVPMLDDRLEVEVGLRPAFLHDYKIGEDNFGGNLQFTSHAGLTLRWQEISLSYRIQHTSNASIYEQNKGLNLHLVGLGGRF
ncbi:MAG: acyloxyacyl hydrolase [Desulfuromonadales bacterium]|nr:acyloxyacyl hydrolase [Desulfuromonadales bacterium]MDH3869822.1 acyloxyacyl hydrolase [Desulfuromonadales bacterium]MDH4024532.1 acyloxyacyl hydrolase [Desulfuromonadales bacterium]